MKKVLFIHHGGIEGGAPLSMLYTMIGVRDRGYIPIVGLVRPSSALHNIYNNEGFLTFEFPWIPLLLTWSGSEGKRYNPVMWKGVYIAWKNWSFAKKKIINFISNNNIDMVHLNSISLSNVASILNDKKIPYVWHVREHGPKHRGLRYGFIQKKLLQAKNVIFLTKAEQESWVRYSNHGTVIHNFLDFKKFDIDIDTKIVSKELNIDNNTKIILYVGGIKEHKGIIVLLHALRIIREKYEGNILCLMPDSYIHPKSKKNKLQNKVLSLIKENKLQSICQLMPFNPNIVNLFALCDMLVFPAIKPHFARPIIEASGMKKPVVASNLKAIDELVVNNETGYLIPANKPEILAEKVILLLKNPKLCERMGGNGYNFSLEHFELNKQIKKILTVYENT